MPEHLQEAEGMGLYIKRTIPYKYVPNTPANLVSLDLYSYAPLASLKPVVLYVHGGGWATGDKANKLANKLALFQSLDYLFVSVNYRLSPTPAALTDGNRIKYPVHSTDVADAVKWVADSIGRYGGDPAKIVLLGHSAGAHLVALTGTSPLFLPARHLPLTFLRGIAAIDTEGYDVLTQSSEELYQNAFGTDPAQQREASPVYNVTSAARYPRFFVATRGSAARVALADAFVKQLQAAGVPVSQVRGSQYDHEGINNAIGDPQDTVITPALTAFLAAAFQ
ncbi:alpha/beta hydrolase [Hymenobacter sp. YC55]|uniref:alpha/beta hydrolase n=1 Tax=Hymenobacter sp. YC55 TaxID=3034019 RepID=UPI0023F7479C|nr:alpha/beta hydrolase [Hymenobacter sp. YC55]MDF7815425.1 alpha/beta hydrolase [Hymenobacter sp. YC55]